MSNYYITTERIFTPLRKWSWIFLFIVAFGGLWIPKLGLLMIPVMAVLPVMGLLQGKMWCGNVCPHGSFFDRFIQWISFNKKIPFWAKSKTAAAVMLAVFMTVMTTRLTAVFETWGSAAFTDKLGLVFVMNYLMVTVLGTAFAVFVNPRTWCNFCPMGTFQLLFYKLGQKLGLTRRTDNRVSVLHEDMCHKCGKCARVCPMHIAPYVELNENHQVGNDSCIKCSTCVNNCPAGILSLQKQETAIIATASADLTGYENKKTISAVIESITLHGDSVKEIWFRPNDSSKFTFQPGQFVLVKVEDEPPMFRAFSISSADTDGETFSVTVKKAPDGYGSEIIFSRFQEGEKVEIEGPMGRDLIPDSSADRIVLVAGGIGITPFVSVIKNILEQGSTRELTLIYGAADADNFIYYDYFKEYEEKYSNFRFIPVAADAKGWNGRTGFVTDVLKEMNLNESRIYMCGPEAMTVNSMALFRNMNIPESSISFEKA